MQELGKGRGDHGHEKLQPWRNKSTETPLVQTLEMQQVEGGGAGPQQQGSAFFYRDIVAISRLVASGPAGVLVPPATKLEGELERKRPREVQNPRLPTLWESSLPRTQQKRRQRHFDYFPNGTQRQGMKGHWGQRGSRLSEMSFTIWGCLLFYSD